MGAPIRRAPLTKTTTMIQPTKKEKAAAFESGARIVANLPTCVRAGDRTAVLNIVDALRGSSTPYWIYRSDGDVTELAAGIHGYLIAVDGRVATKSDVTLTRQALAAAPPKEDRHATHADAARERAGEIAMQIRDAHLRAAVMAHIDGWAAVRKLGVIDQSDRHGTLCRAPGDNILALVLIVRCPSTGRHYGMLVPKECRSAEDARRWVMGLSATDPLPEVET